MNFGINFKNGWVNENTLSPNKLYFYRLQFPVELNKASFGCRISFYTIEGMLLYYKRQRFAHELHSKEEVQQAIDSIKLPGNGPDIPDPGMKFVKWSNEGNMAYFWEYSPLDYSAGGIMSTFLNLRDLYCYRINESENDFEMISNLKVIDFGYSEMEIIEQLDSMGIRKETWSCDPNPLALPFSFFRKKWYP